MKKLVLFLVYALLVQMSGLAQNKQANLRIELDSDNKSDYKMIPHGKDLILAYMQDKAKDEAKKSISQLHLITYNSKLEENKHDIVNLPVKYHILSYTMQGEKLWFLCAPVYNYHIYNTTKELHFISYNLKTGEVTKTQKELAQVFAFRDMDLIGNELVLSGTTGKVIPTMGAFTPCFIFFNIQSLTSQTINYKTEELKETKSQIVATYFDDSDSSLYLFHRYKQNEEGVAEILRMNNKQISKYATLTVPKGLELYDGGISKIGKLFYVYGNYGMYSKYHEKPLAFSKGAFITVIDNGKPISENRYSLSDLGIDISLKVNGRPIEPKEKAGTMVGGPSEPCFIQFHEPIIYNEHIRFLGEINIPVISSADAYFIGEEGYKIVGIVYFDITLDGELREKKKHLQEFGMMNTGSDNLSDIKTTGKFHVPYTYVWQDERAYCVTVEDDQMYLYNAETNGLTYTKFSLEKEVSKTMQCQSNNPEFQIRKFEYFNSLLPKDYFTYHITPWYDQYLIYSGSQYLENKSPKAKVSGMDVFFIQKISTE